MLYIDASVSLDKNQGTEVSRIVSKWTTKYRKIHIFDAALTETVNSNLNFFDRLYYISDISAI